MTNESEMRNPIEITGEQISQAENRSLRIACHLYLIMGVAGLVTWKLSGSEAPKLDGMVSIVAWVTALVAAWVAVQALKKPTEEYPYGRFVHENIYIMFRGLMIFGVVVGALLSSVSAIIQYFVTREGEMFDLKILIIYAVVMLILCVALMQVHKRNNKKVGNKSGLLTVESKSAMIDGLLSGAIGVGFLAFGLIPDGTCITSDTFNIKFIADSIIVVILCVLMLSTPWIIFKTELQRILGKRVDRDIEDEIRSFTQSALEEQGIADQYQINDVFATRQGKSTFVDVRLAYAGNKPVAELDAFRARFQARLGKRFVGVHPYVIFSRLRIHEAGQTESADPDAPAPST